MSPSTINQLALYSRQAAGYLGIEVSVNTAEQAINTVQSTLWMMKDETLRNVRNHEAYPLLKECYDLVYTRLFGEPEAHGQPENQLPEKTLSERKIALFAAEPRLSLNGSDSSSDDGEEKFFDAQEYTETEKAIMADLKKTDDLDEFFEAPEYTDTELSEQIAKAKTNARNAETSTPALSGKAPSEYQTVRKATGRQKRADSRPAVGFGSTVPRERTGKGMTRDEMIQDFNGHIRDYAQPGSGKPKVRSSASVAVRASTALAKKPAAKQKENYASAAEGERIWKDGLRKQRPTKKKHYKKLSAEQQQHLNMLSTPKKVDEVKNPPRLSHSESETKWRKSLRK